MYEYKCACGKEYKCMSSLSSHGNKSRKNVNEGNGCPVYQQRKKENLPLNVGTKLNKVENNDNIENDNIINDLRKKIKSLELLKETNLQTIKMYSDSNNEQQKIIDELQNKLNKRNTNTINNINSGNTINNNINIHIHNSSEETLDSFFINFFGTALKTVYNDFIAFKPGVGDIKDFENPQISKYKGHLNLPIALYNDKNHPENKTFKWDHRLNKGFIKKNDKWIEIGLINLTKEVKYRMVDILNPIVDHMYTETPLQLFAHRIFTDHLNHNEKMILMDIIRLLKMKKPADDKNDEYEDCFDHKHWNIIDNDYKKFIQS